MRGWAFRIGMCAPCRHAPSSRCRSAVRNPSYCRQHALGSIRVGEPKLFVRRRAAQRSTDDLPSFFRLLCCSPPLLMGTFETHAIRRFVRPVMGGPEVFGPRSKGRESPGPDSTTLLSARPIRRTAPGKSGAKVKRHAGVCPCPLSSRDDAWLFDVHQAGCASMTL